MLTYPINLVGLAHRRCLVVGGGNVALRKVEGLLDAGAAVDVVSPEVNEELAALAAEGIVNLIERTYEPRDLKGAFLVIAATDDRTVNREVAAAAFAAGLLVNAVDDPDASNFIVPAVMRRGELAISVSTGGASPALARHLREELETQFGPEYGDLVGIIAELRADIITHLPPGRPRLEAALQLIDRDFAEFLREHGREATLEEARRLLDLD